MMPSSGQVEKLTFCTLAALDCPPAVSPAAGFLSQVGEAERQGADSDRPELNAGLTLQFQLDKAPAVAPAQIFWTGMYGRRSSIVTNTAEDLIGTNTQPRWSRAPRWPRVIPPAATCMETRLPRNYPPVGLPSF